MRATGTVVDRIYPFLARLQHMSSRIMQVKTMVEDLHNVLQRQQEHLSQLDHRLVDSLALAKDLAVETGQMSSRSSAQRAGGSLGMLGGRASGPMSEEVPGGLRSGDFLRINNLLDRQISLLEQAKTSGGQASELSKRCTIGTRILSQRLKEAG